MNAQHTSIKQEHYTPVPIIEAARITMGDIRLDPASDYLGNRQVKAAQIFTKEDDGLSKEWYADSVFLNPPGGRINGRKSSQTAWWDKLYSEYEVGNVSQAIFIGFSLEILAKRGYEILRLPICIPQPKSKTGASFVTESGRIKFLEAKGEEMIEQRSPTHGNIIVYLPPENTADFGYRVELFRDCFEKFGVINFNQF